MAMLGSSPTAVDPLLSIDVSGKSFYALRMTGYEHLGQLSEYTIELAGTIDDSGVAEEIDLHDLLGKTATVQVHQRLADRFFHGYIVRASQLESRGRYPGFRLSIRPWLWFATQRRNSKVFQEKSVKEIVTEVLSDYSGEQSSWELESEGDYPKLDYVVQYEETDYDFISRLLEEAGIYYYFLHEEGSHKLVFTDATTKHEALPESGDIPWRNTMQTGETITNWRVQEEIRSIKTVITEYDYLDPTNRDIKGELDFTKKIGTPLGPMEWFEHPARVVQNSAKAAPTVATTPMSNRAKTRMGEVGGLFRVATGLTNAQDFGVGYKFTLSNAEPASHNGEYLIVSAVYRIDYGDYDNVEGLGRGASAQGGRRGRQAAQPAREGFRCEFVCQSHDLPDYRSPRVTRRPVIAGPQTAVVVGKSTNEIETDEHGRVKVQFHWDRLGARDEKASCWVRVMTPWASKGYGMVGLPRVGDEVVVQFLDGDPDRPIVIGAVYNKENAPPYKLPDHATVSGIKSRSSKEGDKANANELRFDDKKDSEYIWLHAEKDFFSIVKNDAFHQVGNIETVKVGKTRNEAIGENWLMDITQDVMHHVGKDLHVNVEGDIFYTGGATWQVKLAKDLQVKAASVVIDAQSGILLKCGGSIVNISSAGVDIVGSMVKVNSGGGGAGANVAEAKKEDSLTASDYANQFKDPIPDGEGGLPPVP